MESLIRFVAICAQSRQMVENKANKMRPKCQTENAKKLARQEISGGVRVRFRVRFQAVKVPIFGGLRVENPIDKATASKLF